MLLLVKSDSPSRDESFFASRRSHRGESGALLLRVNGGTDNNEAPLRRSSGLLPGGLRRVAGKGDLGARPLDPMNHDATIHCMVSTERSGGVGG